MAADYNLTFTMDKVSAGHVTTLLAKLAGYDGSESSTLEPLCRDTYFWSWIVVDCRHEKSLNLTSALI